MANEYTLYVRIRRTVNDIEQGQTISETIRQKLETVPNIEFSTRIVTKTEDGE